MKLNYKQTEIVVGRPLEYDVLDRWKRLLLKRGTVISDESQIESLRDRGAYLDKSNDQSLVDKENSISSPFELLDQVHARMNGIYSKEGDFRDLCPVVMNLSRLIHEACNKDPDACLSTLLRPPSLAIHPRYSIKHQIDTAIACEIVSKRMEYSPENRRSILAAALTMNIAMYTMQDMLYFQQDSVGRFIRRKIEAHVVEGIEILKQHYVTDKIWIDAVLQHHEQMNGNGYPNGLKGNEICESARILRIADIYCAKVSGRAFRNPISPYRALREIYENARGHFIDKDLVRLFIEELGLFPPGCYVRLVNGDIAIVTNRGNRPNEPVVRSTIRPSGIPYMKPVLRDCSDRKFAIQETVWMPYSKVAVDRNWLWGYGGG